MLRVLVRTPHQFLHWLDVCSQENIIFCITADERWVIRQQHRDHTAIFRGGECRVHGDATRRMVLIYFSNIYSFVLPEFPAQGHTVQIDIVCPLTAHWRDRRFFFTTCNWLPVILSSSNWNWSCRMDISAQNRRFNTSLMNKCKWSEQNFHGVI